MRPAWQITEFDPHSASPEMWRMYHAYRRARQLEREPDDPVPPDDEFERGWRQEVEDQDWAHYDAVVALDGQIISAFGAGAPKPGTPDYATNGHLMWVTAAVLEPWRRRGIGHAWLRYALDKLPLTGATTLTTGAQEPDGHAFLQWLAGDPKQRQRYSRVDFRTLDWETIDRWVAEQAVRAPGYALEVYNGRLPEPLWEEYCAAKTEQMRHIPRDDLDMGDWNFDADDQREFYKRLDVYQADHHVVWVRDPGGRIVAITDIGYFPYEPHYIQQFFTGVHPDARGLGLGKLVKARMLQCVRAAYADKDIHWVRTDNATTNAAMLAINERLGFREYKVTGIYQARVERIKEVLGESG